MQYSYPQFNNTMYKVVYPSPIYYLPPSNVVNNVNKQTESYYSLPYFYLAPVQEDTKSIDEKTTDKDVNTNKNVNIVNPYLTYYSVPYVHTNVGSAYFLNNFQSYWT